VEWTETIIQMPAISENLPAWNVSYDWPSEGDEWSREQHLASWPTTFTNFSELLAPGALITAPFFYQLQSRVRMEAPLYSSNVIVREKPERT
jgi:hypothetical protein